MKEPGTLDCLNVQLIPRSPLIQALALFVVAAHTSLLPIHVRAESPVRPPLAITPLDKEQDRLDKQLLEEKVARELEENRRRALESSTQEKRNGVVAPPGVKDEDLSDERAK